MPIKQELNTLLKKPELPDLPGSLLSYYLAEVYKKSGKTVIFITKDKKKQNIITTDFKENSCLIPELDISHSSFAEPHLSFKQHYFSSLYSLLHNNCKVVVTHPYTLLKKIPCVNSLSHMFINISKGNDEDLYKLEKFLTLTGYKKEDIVRTRGEFSKRGDILDIFPINSDYPIRIETEFDTVETIKLFDPTTQRSLKEKESVVIFPYQLFLHSDENKDRLKAEFLKRFQGNVEVKLSLEEKISLIENGELDGFDNYFAFLYKDNQIMELMQNCAFVVDETYNNLKSDLNDYFKQIKQESIEENSNGYLSINPEIDFNKKDEILNFIDKNLFATMRHQESNYSTINLKSPKLETMLTSIEKLTKNHIVEIASPLPSNRKKLEEMLFEKGIPYTYIEQKKEIVFLSDCPFEHGFCIKNSFAFIPYSSLFEKKKKIRTTQSYSPFFSDFSDIKQGDYVVHIDYGIAKFLGIVEIETGGSFEEFLKLEFAGNSSVLLPISRVHLLQKYQHSGDLKIHLSNIKSNSFKKTKKRIEKQILEYAEELLKLYAERKVAKGISFTTSSPWQEEFAMEFKYTETEDQLKAIEEIMEDMQAPYPMDRLLCGDVGFGKTEVAMRAAFTAIDNGYQVMVLSPTTVLAFQHFENFKERFKSFPAKIEMLSRFVSPKKQKETVNKFNKGEIDILIGTHRIFSKDIIPKKLGLLIIDEEQKFGVMHKEKLKMLKKNIDVLSLSATPIPRTLNMSVMGFKDISIIESPPKDRQAINTCHIVFDPVTIKKAIEVELARGGQIYFVNNHVKTIETLAKTVRKLSPENTKIAVAHGQMDDEELEQVMLNFFKGETDILVCTTIIENGMDVTNANTMFINEAHTFGLSQLYQLRGRIGRSDKPAYAYLITPGKQTLTEDARTRLDALQEFSHLGAGFRIAMLDLELRGAGDILGSKQSGHINEIGFELYSNLLEKAVKELKNEEIIEEETVLQMGKSGFIPKDYIENSSLRLSFVRKLNLTSSFEQLLKVKEELVDRFGIIPEKLLNLIEGHRLRLILREIGVQSVEFTKDKCVIYPCPKNKFNIETIVKEILVNKNIKLLPEGYISFTNSHNNLNDFIQEIIKFVTKNKL